ncbi:cytoplasmic protein [Companilactobacillus nuruki]|uniref:Cytoplasmic protein n=2 Tax=Companilactobacillus nuruki TaxID=1993540 RepID=A0A2N7ARB7_9LACO|nr:cytoplasmic protein [Companilactobacillus nuruki]
MKGDEGMQVYKNSTELIDQIKESYHKFIDEYEGINDDVADERIDQVDKTPREMLSYQVGWINMILSWEKAEAGGAKITTPTPGYKWDQMRQLYHDFNIKYGSDGIENEKAELGSVVAELITWIDDMSHDELFKPGERKWATTKAMWPVAKWIRINAVSPFNNYSRQVRKWKNFNLRDKKIVNS